MPKGTTGITTLYLYNRFVNDVADAPSTDINDTETLRWTIDQVNNLIGQKCARNFGSATYKEWIDTKGMSYVVVNNYPITSVKLASTSSVDLLTVEGTGFSVATVSSDDDGLTLHSIATDATETDTEFAYATYTNVTDLVTAIDLISGWDAEVLSNYGSSLTQLIRPNGSEWCLDEKAYFQGPYLGVKARVSYDSDAVVELGGCPGGSMFLWYTAGYTLPVCNDQGNALTTDGNVPEGLTLCANRIIKDYLHQKDEDTNMSKEKNMDYEYQRDGIMSAIDRHWSDLCIYARKSV